VTSNTVFESGLPGGTAEGSAPRTTQGTITIGDPDGLDDIQSITIAGTTFDVSGGLEGLVGQSVDTGYGTLTITSYSDGQYGFSYALDERVDNDTAATGTDTGYVEKIDLVVADSETSASTTIDITIRDDAPLAGFDVDPDGIVIAEADIGSGAGTAILSLDVSGEASQPGADRPATRSFSLDLSGEGADSGLRTTAGDSIRLYSDGSGGVIGRTAGGTPVFTLSLDATTGALTVTMLATMQHPPGTDVLYMQPNVLTATVSITDADGDTDTTQFDLSTHIGFRDSAPVITAVENASIDNQAGLSVSGTISGEAPDGIVGWDLSESLDNAPAGMSYALQPDGSLVAKDSTGDTVFTLSIDASGKYTFTLLKPAAEYVASSPNFSGLVLEPGNPVASALTQLYAAYDPVTGAGIGDPITSVVFTGTSALNPSRDGLGVGDNLIDDPGNKVDSDVLRMEFTDDLSNATIGIGNFKNSEALQWSVYKDGVLVDSGTISGTYVKPDGSSGTIANNESPNYQFDLSRNGLDHGVLFDELRLSAADCTAYKFIAFTVEKPVSVDDMDLQFDVKARDADGDVSGTGHFVVSVDGTGNTIDDNAGDTVLIGGDGADVFRWTLAETGAHDTVGDFSMQSVPSGGDALDLADLLPQGGDRVGELSSYLHFEDSGHGSTLLKISSSGGFTGDAAHDATVAHQTIELQNVDLLGLGSDQQIIDHLVSNGKLITDH
jgi:hypothetical protein